ncbi:hydantoinase B/oxoprolinase family protein [Dyadobacter tibetensis]|uniref:hydantoinase B/oxoprolinase family protein n=1 Tax=Dyadobacter tibetensis TaxID=1211851 RepID=UPI0004B1C301|nr:hydantoinase B/oxoprolinase family protein [Dyadobacter tibetensis]
MNPIWKINIDTGGTFTDCLAQSPAGMVTRIKVLSSARLRGRITKKITPQHYHFESSWHFPDDLLVGFTLKLPGTELTSTVISLNFAKGLIELSTDFDLPNTQDFEVFSGEEAPIFAARLLTQTPLSDALPPIDMRLGTTKGTNALLERKGARTLLVVTKGFKDLLYIGSQQRPELFQLHIPEPALFYTGVLEIDARMDAQGTIIKPLDLSSIHCPDVHHFDSVAISLLHSYKNNEHERQLAAFLKEQGFRHISFSSQLYAFSHYQRRSQTAVVNAYLEPVLDAYLSNIAKSISAGRLRVMNSAGSLSEAHAFQAKDSLLSGPAGGMVAATNIAKRFGFEKVITFDMGGTSTDTARIDRLPELQYITEIDGLELHNPALAIETVAAGGGSICWYDGFSLKVGPHSAGAAPGPACYGAGGPLTMTDINLLLGKLNPARFGIPIDVRPAQAALQDIQQAIHVSSGNWLSDQEVLSGFEKIANEKMADAIRTISVAKGIDPTDHALVTFGGAGGLHSCQLADLLGITRVIVPYDAGLFSAVGMGEALNSVIVSRQILKSWPEIAADLDRLSQDMEKEAAMELSLQGIDAYTVLFSKVFLRFVGQENSLEIAYHGADTLQRFEAQYRAQFGYYPSKGVVEVESFRLMAQEASEAIRPASILSEGRVIASSKTSDDAFPCFDWDELEAGDALVGPCILLNNTSTTFLPEGWKLVIQQYKDAIAFRTTEKTNSGEEENEAVALQLYANRFAAIADEMGAQLQRTAYSVNVKERLDFSCALVDFDGELLVNAQHIPVHLGSMGICTRLVRDFIDIGPGDVVITNHPKYGGSHLPDITLIAGVFTPDRQCVGYVINRAHHAEVGGKTPGSMPPDAVNLAEEGVVILPQYLVKNNEFQWDSLRKLFLDGPYPTRSYPSNEADIIAALSALKKGSTQLLELVAQAGLEAVKNYMRLLKKSAESQLNQALLPHLDRTFTAMERLDDGHEIRVSIHITKEKQVFDFTGTSLVHPNNLNANISILYSAILYVFRLLIDKNVPLNDGLMRNVSLVLPANSFLHPDFSDNPRECPAVVGGNTEVSQRLVDTLLKAFDLSACSQGTMNNFLFGDNSFGYYETIGGGTGAGKNHPGRSAVHQHMTNTRITDPEPLELKYPVRLLEFGIRKNSGGAGHQHGGNGIRRIIAFLKPVKVTLIGQHRTVAPYGLSGGQPGACGRHTLLKKDAETIVLPGICSLDVEQGDVIKIETPGGGGFGSDQS